MSHTARLISYHVEIKFPNEQFFIPASKNNKVRKSCTTLRRTKTKTNTQNKVLFLIEYRALEKVFCMENGVQKYKSQCANNQKENNVIKKN